MIHRGYSKSFNSYRNYMKFPLNFSKLSLKTIKTRTKNLDQISVSISFTRIICSGSLFSVSKGATTLDCFLESCIWTSEPILDHCSKAPQDSTPVYVIQMVGRAKLGIGWT